MNKIFRGFLLLNCFYLFFTGLSAFSVQEVTNVPGGQWEGVVLMLLSAGIAVVVSEIQFRSVVFWAVLSLLALGYFLYYVFYFLPRVPDLTSTERSLGWSLAAFGCLPGVIAFGARMVDSSSKNRKTTKGSHFTPR